jgi:hypothetical protein
MTTRQKRLSTRQKRPPTAVGGGCSVILARKSQRQQQNGARKRLLGWVDRTDAQAPCSDKTLRYLRARRPIGVHANCFCTVEPNPKLPKRRREIGSDRADADQNSRSETLHSEAEPPASHLASVYTVPANLKRQYRMSPTEEGKLPAIDCQIANVAETPAGCVRRGGSAERSPANTVAGRFRETASAI